MDRAPSGTVTVLFTDLVGSTEQRQRLGDDEAEQLRRVHFGLLRDALKLGRGHEVKNMGDGLMVAFSSALDALACAIAIQQGMHRHNEGRPDDHRLHVRVGAHVGEPVHDEEDYFGTSVDIAGRLCDSAQGGQIVVSELVRALVGNWGGHAFRALGPLSLKGLERPLPACEVLWEPAPAPSEGSKREAEPPQLPLPSPLAVGKRTVFVGRERECDLLDRCWKRARTGERQVVLLGGDAGIGKTRLAAEFANGVHGQGASVLYGRCDEDALVQCQPFVQALRQCAVLVSDAEVIASDLGTATDTAEPERDATLERAATLLAELAARLPLVLVVDDLQWADRPALRLFRHLVRSPQQSPLLIIGAYREVEIQRSHPLRELLADLRRSQLFEHVSLSGLDFHDSGRLIDAASVLVTSPDVVRAVHERTEGNPFFIEELLRDLAETHSGNV